VSQTALNLIAIAIFTMVMSVLLGPWLHISPFIPAIATFGLLSIATVDTLSWQGQGATLLVDWAARFSKEHRDRVLHHEAGHFLVAHLLQIPITGYTLSAWESFRKGQPGLGGVSFGSDELDAELAQGKLSDQLIDRYCTVWMAGSAAETLVYGTVEGGTDDRQKLLILWSQLRRPAEQGLLKERWALLQAKTLIETHRDAYDALVAAMENRVSAEDCKQQIEQHRIVSEGV
jgi:hypothetical protein